MALRHLIKKIELSTKLHPLEKALAEVRIRSVAMNPKRRKLYRYNKEKRSFFTALNWYGGKEIPDEYFIPSEYWKHIHNCTKDVYVEDAYATEGEIFVGDYRRHGQ